MTNSEKLSEYFNEYRADYDAAIIAERNGNINGASALYRAAALALCNMAKLETGETRRQRMLHAADIKQHIDGLTGQSIPQNNNTGASVVNTHEGNAVAGQENDESNPWKSEGIPTTTFDDVIGMEDVKQLIRERVIDQIRHPELYEEYGLTGGTGLLLFGLPGTGKTTIARAIAHEINAPLYIVNLSDVLSKWVGESEKLISQLFDKARQDPVSLIFFDDFDELGRERRDDGSHNNKVIVELIGQMDGFKRNKNVIVLLAATNKPWMIDSALMRPGRFEHHVYVPLPNHEARKMLVAKNMGSVPMEDTVNLDDVSDLMCGYNGADVVSVVRSAKTFGLQRAKQLLEREGIDRRDPITFQDFANAATMHKSSVDADDIVEMRKYASTYGISLPDKL